MKWLVLSIAFAACAVAFSMPKLATPALVIAFVCGLIGLGYLALRRGPTGPTDQRGGDPRDEGGFGPS